MSGVWQHEGFHSWTSGWTQATSGSAEWIKLTGDIEWNRCSCRAITSNLKLLISCFNKQCQRKADGLNQISLSRMLSDKEKIEYSTLKASLRDRTDGDLTRTKLIQKKSSFTEQLDWWKRCQVRCRENQVVIRNPQASFCVRTIRICETDETLERARDNHCRNSSFLEKIWPQIIVFSELGEEALDKLVKILRTIEKRYNL